VAGRLDRRGCYPGQLLIPSAPGLFQVKHRADHTRQMINSERLGGWVLKFGFSTGTSMMASCSASRRNALRRASRRVNLTHVENKFSSSLPGSKSLIAEADRLEAGGFNLVMDIKRETATVTAELNHSNPTVRAS